MLILQSAGLFVISICFLSLVGLLAAHLFQLELEITEYPALGFVCFLGVIEFFCWYTVAFRMKMLLFSFISGTIIMLLLIVGVVFLIRKGIPSFKRSEIVWLILSIIITFILIALTFLYYRSDADDSFYVSNVNLFANSEYINSYDSSFGNQSLASVPMYDFQVWETLMAFVVRISGIEAATLMHTSCVPILLCVSASAYMMLGNRLANNQGMKYATLFYLFLTIYHIFMGGASGYSAGAFLLTRLWQGKAVYLHITLPVMIALGIQHFGKKKDINYAVLLAICFLCGISLNPTSMYILGFELIAFTVAFAIRLKNGRELLYIVPSIIITGVFLFLIYFRTSMYPEQVKAASLAGTDFFYSTLKNFLGEGKWYVLLFIIAGVFLVIKGGEKLRVFLLGTSIILLICVWNPWMGQLIAVHVTKVPSFWRVFWLIPIGYTIAAAGAVLVFSIKKRILKIIILCATIVIISLPGKNLFITTNEIKFVNFDDRLPRQMTAISEIIHAETAPSIVLSSDRFSSTLRQKYVNIELVYSRHQYILDLFLYRGKETEAEERIILEEFANYRLENMSLVDELLDKYKVDYVIIGNDSESAAYMRSIDKWTERVVGGFSVFERD